MLDITRESSRWSRLMHSSSPEPLRVLLARSHMAAWLRYVDPSYKPIWYTDLIAHYLTALRRTLHGDTGPGSLDVVIVRVAPQHGKTKICCEGGPAFFASTLPEHRSLALAYAAPLARRNIRAVSALAKTKAFQRLSPVRIGKMRDAESGELVTDESKAEMVRFLVQEGGHVRQGPGYYISAGIGGMLTGWSVDATWIDDLIRSPAEAWSASQREALVERVKSVVISRWQDRATLCVSMTPWHHKDISHVLEEECRAAGLRVEVLDLPAVAEPGIKLHRHDPREPGSGEILDQVRHSPAYYARQRALSGAWWKYLYQLDVSPDKEGLIDPWVWPVYDPRELLLRRKVPLALMISVDPNADEGTSSPAHISAGVVVRDASKKPGTAPCLWKLHEETGRWPLSVLWGRLRGLAESYAKAAEGLCPLHIVIERKVLGPALCQSIEAWIPQMPRTEIHLHSYYPQGSKRVRAMQATAAIMAGLVQLPAADVTPVILPSGRLEVLPEPCGWLDAHRRSWHLYDEEAPGDADRVDADAQMILHAVNLGLVTI